MHAIKGVDSLANPVEDVPHSACPWHMSETGVKHKVKAAKQLCTYSQQMNRAIISNNAPRERHDVVHVLPGRSEAASDGRAEERVLVAGQGSQSHAHGYWVMHAHMKVALSVLRSSYTPP